MEKQRIEWIDLAKGYGIILVIMGHAICPRPLLYWLHTFHMPLFFFLSGCTFNFDKYKDIKLFLVSRVKTILIPYFVISIIFYAWKIIDWIVFGNPYNIVYSLLGIIVQVRGSDLGPGIWFLPLLFVAEIVLWIILKISGKSKLKAFLISVVFMVLAYFYCRFIDVKLPWAMDAAPIAAFFMILGQLFRDTIAELRKWGLLFIVPNILLGFVNEHLFHIRVDMWANDYGDLVLFILSAVSGIIFSVSLMQMIHSRLLTYIGRYSLYYYGLHFIVIELVNMLLDKFVDRGIKGSSMIALAITMVLVIVLLNRIPEYLNKCVNAFCNRVIKLNNN